MYDFIVQSVVFISFGVIVYVIVRALPRVADGNDTSQGIDTKNRRFISSLSLDKADAFVNTLFEKTLRRLKVFILRADNFITASLGKIISKKGDQNGKDIPR